MTASERMRRELIAMSNESPLKMSRQTNDLYPNSQGLGLNLRQTLPEQVITRPTSDVGVGSVHSARLSEPKSRLQSQVAFGMERLELPVQYQAGKDIDDSPAHVMVIESEVTENLVPSLVQSNIATEVRGKSKSPKRRMDGRNSSVPQRLGSDSNSPIRKLVHDGGYNLSKSYTFKCTTCDGSFIKLMILELTHAEAEALSKYKV